MHPMTLDFRYVSHRSLASLIWIRLSRASVELRSNLHNGAIHLEKDPTLVLLRRSPGKVQRDLMNVGLAARHYVTLIELSSYS